MNSQVERAAVEYLSWPAPPPRRRRADQGYLSLVEGNRPPARGPEATLAEKFRVWDQILKCGSRPRGWDGYSAEPPSPVAIEKAQETLEMLHRLGSLPTKAVPMADGGLSLVIMARPFLAAIEFYNDGEAVVAFSDREKRHVAWEVTTEEAQLKAAIERLRGLMHG